MAIAASGRLHQLQHAHDRYPDSVSAITYTWLREQSLSSSAVMGVMLFLTLRWRRFCYFWIASSSDRNRQRWRSYIVKEMLRWKRPWDHYSRVPEEEEILDRAPAGLTCAGIGFPYSGARLPE